MELVAALPAELVCVADPAARGAAPLLRPTPAPADSAAPGAPFALFLELLATAAPTRQGLPAGGNDLVRVERRPDLFHKAIAAAADASQGVMIFDMVYLYLYDSWGILNEAFPDVRAAPHDEAGLLEAVREAHSRHRAGLAH